MPKDFLFIAIFIIGYFVVMKFVLPRLGVPT